MFYPSLVAQSSWLAPSKIENQYSDFSVYPVGQLPSASAFSSAAGEWLSYSVLEIKILVILSANSSLN